MITKNQSESCYSSHQNCLKDKRQYPNSLMTKSKVLWQPLCTLETLKSKFYFVWYRGSSDNTVSISTVPGSTRIFLKGNSRIPRFNTVFYKKKSFLATWNPNQATNFVHLWHLIKIISGCKIHWLILCLLLKLLEKC